MKCPKCNTEFAKGANFCSHCGKNVSGRRPAISEPEPAPKKAAAGEKKTGRRSASSSRAQAFLSRSEADAEKTRSKRKRFFVKSFVFLLLVGVGVFLAAARGWLGPDAERVTRPHDPTAGKLPAWLEKKNEEGAASVSTASTAAVESASTAPVESASPR